MNLKILRILLSFLLIISILDLPYGYYTFIRIFTTIVSLILVYKARELNKNFWMTVFIITAILFNPVFPIYFNKETWIAIDIISAILLMVSTKFLRFERIITEEKYLQAQKNIDERKKK